MLRTVEQIAVEIGVDVQVITDFLTVHKIRAAREDGQSKYYDEAAERLIIQGLSGNTVSAEAHHDVHHEAHHDTVTEALVDIPIGLTYSSDV